LIVVASPVKPLTVVASREVSDETSARTPVMIARGPVAVAEAEAAAIGSAAMPRTQVAIDRAVTNLMLMCSKVDKKSDGL
jgi:hypothetical protein